MKKKGSLLITAGLVMIGAALMLTGYNIWDNKRAEKTAAENAAVLSEKIQEAAVNSLDNFTSDDVPLYVRYPEMEMPSIDIDGSEYLGILEIPSLGLELPVKSSYSLAALKEAPCLYSGSVYTDDIIICGHNYQAHFGSLKNLSGGSRVNFTDGDGHVFNYQVIGISELDGSDIEGMEAEQENNSWDMTLFTCSLSGRMRETVRLERLNK